MSPNRSSKKPSARLRTNGNIEGTGPLLKQAAPFLVVGVGSSAGGLEACRKLLKALPSHSGMAFILVQHLDPTHESLMVELLEPHTTMPVCQATNGMVVERDHVYVIPPGMYLAITGNSLILSEPPVRHGARLPFDFLLASMAHAYGSRAACIVLSGTGADGSMGLKAIKAKNGFVIAQDPDEAGYDGMPRSAVATGKTDATLFIAAMPDALKAHAMQGSHAESSNTGGSSLDAKRADITSIIDLLRERTKHDFQFYKRGTLQRRIERRMAIASINENDHASYLIKLKADENELEALAKDLLINVTSFFRDTSVFDTLASTTIPTLIAEHKTDQPLRIWIAGCSSGEEAYSLTILFREAIAAERRNIKLQVFASDIDQDAVAIAREGIYPASVESDISQERLERFFSKEEHGYRVLPHLRSSVVFTVQDVLSDAPFSRLDFISCRNLLIYLSPDAQARVMTMFHFALRPDGILLLGSAESTGNMDGRFEVQSKTAKLYRRIGHSRPGELSFLLGNGDSATLRSTTGLSQSAQRQTAIASLCRRLVLEAFAPAAVLVNRKHECIYSMGSTDRYLQVAPGHPTHDLLAMAPSRLKTKLRSAMQQASHLNERVIISGCRSTSAEGAAIAFKIDVQPILSEGELLLLVCFVDTPSAADNIVSPVPAADASRVTQLQQELEATRSELQGAIKDMEISGEELKALNEEALSINEECQSTNEELLTSKEELQSLNEELTALNSQLQETLERQRTTSNDLQNVLYSTDVATLFLDSDLNIRFFTPATKSLFNVIPSDIGRPLADLNSLATDADLLEDARTVMKSLSAMEREVEARSGICFIRRILPYRTHNNGVEGVVITFTDITERKQIAKALEAAKLEAELATATKSRFLASASHDLRQPLQTLKLLQGLLVETIEDEPSQKLTKRIGDTIGAMAGMLNALLDINQIETGAVQAHPVSFRIGDLIERMREEFGYHAASQGLALRVIPCSAIVVSDPRLLEQMVRNLLSNAFKYTKRGRVLLGCRRRGDKISLEVWDTGAGIPESQLQAIFDEYHQLDNPARELSLGLGLGLSIVQRLGGLLKHEIRVKSTLRKGSVFSIDVGLAPAESPLEEVSVHLLEPREKQIHNGMILIVEDDPELGDLLGSLLTIEGYHTSVARDGVEALARVAQGGVQPDLILADYNLPKGLTGLEVVIKLRENLRRKIPAIILTGDIATRTSREVALQDCTQINKPAKLKEVVHTIERLLPPTRPPKVGASLDSAISWSELSAPVVFVVDDDNMLRDTMRIVLEADGHIVEDFASCEAFLESYAPNGPACLLLDATLPGMKGIELIQHLREKGDVMPAIMITGQSEVSLAVEAMKAGASDFIQKPFERSELLESVTRAIKNSRDTSMLEAWRQSAADHISELTPRQHEIMNRVLAGQPSKIIAADLGISQRTVENHRASIMKRTESKSIPALARLALAAAKGKTIETPFSPEADSPKAA